MHNEEKNKIALLKYAIDEGIRSGRAEDFDPVELLKALKAARRQEYN